MSPNPFVGPVEQLRGFNNAAWGTLAVVLRNGRPAGTIVPGSRFARGWNGAPLLGRLEIVQIQTDPVELTLSVKDIATADAAGYLVESVTLRVNVAINPAGDFAAFSDHIQTHGPQFASALVVEIENG
ncbi:MAG: hypothetical protein Q7T71_21025, partial [Herbiconiux sp.]|nr:hypothetical protein [Herbiconiux sp.]